MSNGTDGTIRSHLTPSRGGAEGSSSEHLSPSTHSSPPNPVGTQPHTLPTIVAPQPDKAPILKTVVDAVDPVFKIVTWTSAGLAALFSAGFFIDGYFARSSEVRLLRCIVELNRDIVENQLDRNRAIDQLSEKQLAIQQLNAQAKKAAKSATTVNAIQRFNSEIKSIEARIKDHDDTYREAIKKREKSGASCQSDEKGKAK